MQKSTESEKIHAKHLRLYRHTDLMGYEQKLNWLEMMNKKYDQLECPECGLFAIFKRRES